MKRKEKKDSTAGGRRGRAGAGRKGVVLKGKATVLPRSSSYSGFINIAMSREGGEREREGRKSGMRGRGIL